MSQNKAEIPLLQIDGTNIDCVKDFNFFNCQSHTNKKASKINKTIGILDKLKHMLLQNILSIMCTFLFYLILITVCCYDVIKHISNYKKQE